MRFSSLLFVTLGWFVLGAGWANAVFTVQTGEYHLPAAVDPSVLADTPIELWASVTYPVGVDRMPIVVFLHGNHGTCGIGQNPRKDSSCAYTESGSCPEGYTVTPNHLGYQYLAEQLAEQGVLVVSINANRGITCGDGQSGDWGLILARGRLVLRHLQQLTEWNHVGGAPGTVGVDLAGKIDFAHVGLMGHSRGGEGVRAAYNLLKDADSTWPARVDPSLHITGIYEIAPVDGQSDRVLNANGVPWNVLLPMCDGDVSDLEGIRPFDRMLADLGESSGSQKSTFNVWGANHNFFNTEWHLSDSLSCINHEPLWESEGGADKQRQFSLQTVVPFFLSATRLADSHPMQVFDSFFGLPESLSTLGRVERGFTPSVKSDDVLVLRDFKLSSESQPISSALDLRSEVEVTIGHLQEQDPKLAAATVSWDHAGESVFYQIAFGSVTAGVDLSGQSVMEMRLSRPASTRDLVEPLVFSIALVSSDGTLSQPLRSDQWVRLVSPADHDLLFSMRIPLSAFQGIQLQDVRGVRLSFNQSGAGKLQIAQLRSFRGLPVAAQPSPLPVTEPVTIGVISGQQRVFAVRQGTAVLRHQLTSRRASQSTQGPSVEIELRAEDGFEVQNRLPILSIGGERFRASRYPSTGETDRLIFTIPEIDLRRHSPQDRVILNPGPGWNRSRVVFGRLGSIPTEN